MQNVDTGAMFETASLTLPFRLITALLFGSRARIVQMHAFLDRAHNCAIE